MPLPKHVYEAMIEEHAAGHKKAARGRLRAWAIAIIWCWFWVLLGIALIGMALHTTDMTWAHIYFWGGLTVGNGGAMFTLIAAWRAAERRGDFGPPS